MITGDDSVFLSSGRASLAVENFLMDLLKQWPDMRVSIEDDGDEAFRIWASEAVDLPLTAGLVLVARDKEMVDGWDDRGYSLDSHDEGPLSIEYRPAGWNSLKVQVLEDPLSRSSFAFDPYEAVLTGSHYSVVSMVTPSRDSDFSATMISKMAHHLAASDTPPE
jgi:hypothetical protein